MNLGFSYIGLLYLLMLFIPNLFWTKHQPTGYEKYAVRENRILGLFSGSARCLSVRWC